MLILPPPLACVHDNTRSLLDHTEIVPGVPEGSMLLHDRRLHGHLCDSSLQGIAKGRLKITSTLQVR